MLDVMPFGKYRGQPLADIPRSYLQWLLEQEWMEEKDELVEAIENELATRDRSYVDF